MNELEKKKAHTEARLNAVQDLIQFTQQSGKGGEYFISVNGMRLWLSPTEMHKVLRGLRSDLNVKKDYYASLPPKGMLVD